MNLLLIQAKKNIVKILRPLADDQKKYLQGMKDKARKLSKRQDLIWHMLLSSMATMGNARGYVGLICTHENYERITFDALTKEYTLKNRRRLLKATLRRAKVRRADQKAEWLASNFEKISEMGGLSAARKALLISKGQENKIIFLKTFDGISDKYARNIMMDIYHREFHDCIAVDQRIKNISSVLNLSFPDYKSEEDFYRAVASEMDLQAWELDRLLFKFAGEVICMIKMKKNK